MSAWHDKAKRIIGELSHASWKAQNVKPDGSRYRKHRPYSIPEEAEVLLGCLNRDDEEGAKAYFHLLHVRGIN